MDLEFFVVAPEIPDLIEIEDELSFITDHFDTHPQPPLVGVVDAADIEHEVQRHTADVFFIASHNDNDGITVSDGRINEDDIVSYVRSLSATLVILSVCDGERMAKRIHRATGVAVLFCRIEVADRDAMLYTARFVAALARRESYHEAFVEAGNARGRYGLLEGRDTVTSSGAITRLSEQLDALSKEVTNLRIEMIKLSQELNNLKEKNAILPEPAINPRWLWVFFGLMLIIAVGVGAGLIR